MTSAAGLALTERHRLAQGTLAEQAATAMLRLFPLLVAGGAVDVNSPRWIEAVVAVLTAQRAKSAAVTVNYLTAYRAIELGPESLADRIIPAPRLEVPTPAFITSLSVLGPVAYRREVARQLGVDTRELTPRDLAENPLPRTVQQRLAENSARAGMRHVRNGSRETADDFIKADPKVTGYVRSTNAGCCYFCAMLASRGPVYLEDSFADSDPRFHGPGDQKVHDGCGCDLRALYARDSPDDFNVRSRAFAALWAQTGNVLDFRKAYAKIA